jgi:hypothetical protein
MSATQRYEVTVTRANGRVERIAYLAATSLAWTVREIESFGEISLDVNGSRFDGTAEQWLAANGSEVVS